MVCAQTKIQPKEWDAHNSLWFWYTNSSLSFDQTTRPSNSKQKKKTTCRMMTFCLMADHWLKFHESEKRGQDLARELKKTIEQESVYDTHCNWQARNNPQGIGRGTGKLGNKKTKGDHPDNSIIIIGQNTEKSPGDLRRLEETCCHSNSNENPTTNTSVKNFQMWYLQVSESEVGDLSRRRPKGSLKI